MLKAPLYGDPIFREVSQPVGNNVPLAQLLDQMRVAQQHFNHPCIAAKHVGVNVRVLLINTSFDRSRAGAAPFTAIMVNPELKAFINPLIAGLEADPCIPGYQGSVERHSAIEVAYLDENFKEHNGTFTDLAARWVLHGVELLEGKLFIDNLNAHRLRSIKGHLKRIAPHYENGKLKVENGSI